MPNQKAADFKMYYANAISALIGDNDCRVAFGVSDNELLPSQLTESCAVYLTPRTAKILSLYLGKAIENLEATTGKIVELPAGFDQMLATLKPMNPLPPTA